MYKSLKTNLPKEVMAFPDFPFPASKSEYGNLQLNHRNIYWNSYCIFQESFLHHTEVLAYLESYADHFDLKKFIHYNTTVKHVVHSNKEWNVTVENLETGDLTTLKFEAVVVCNGKDIVPKCSRVHMNLVIYFTMLPQLHYFNLPQQNL